MTRFINLDPILFFVLHRGLCNTAVTTTSSRIVLTLRNHRYDDTKDTVSQNRMKFGYFYHCHGVWYT